MTGRDNSRRIAHRRGRLAPHLPPSPLPLPRCGRGRGDGWPPHLSPGPAPFSWPRTFLLASAPFSWPPHLSPDPLTFPLTPFLSRAAGEEGGMVGLRTFLLAPHLPPGPAPSSWPPHLPPSPLPLPRCGRGRGDGWLPHLPPGTLTQWLRGYSTFPIRNQGSCSSKSLSE